MQTFEQFVSNRIRPVIRKASGVGMDHDDFVDANWHDLYSDTNGEASDDEIVQTLAEQDEIFAQMAQIQGYEV